MRRCITSWPLAAVALLLLLCLSRSVAAARHLPLQQQPAGGVHPLAPQQAGADNGVTAAPAAADGLVIQEDEAAGDGDDELSISEMMGEGAEQGLACEEGNDDECLQRRFLLYMRRDYQSRPRPRPRPPGPNRP